MTTRRAVLADGTQLASSLPPFDDFNLGRSTADDPAAVAANRAALQGLVDAKLVWNTQVHGTDVHVLARQSTDGGAFDASVASEPGLACIAGSADCCTALFCLDHPALACPIVAAAHAGWRGLAGGVLEATFNAILKQFGTIAQVSIDFGATKNAALHVHAWIGACIGPTAFEVGDDVRGAFCGQRASDAIHFVPIAPRPGKCLADMPALAHARLTRLGIQSIHGNDGSAAWCTASNPERFYSHRRDAANAGRMASLIWVV